MLYDKDIREPLFDFLEELYGKIRILEEKRIAGSRADVTMVTEDALFGIEIKSDADTYARLASQTLNYDRFFDYNYVVVGTSHAHHIADHIPDYWGIITVEDVEQTADFYILRKPSKNPHVNAADKLTILWRPELAKIQEKNQMAAYKQKSKKFVQEKILEQVPAERLWRQVSEELFERDYTKIKEQIDEFRIANGQKKRRKGYRHKYRIK